MSFATQKAKKECICIVFAMRGHVRLVPGETELDQSRGKIWSMYTDFSDSQKDKN
jgi:hypothetical protein